MTLSGDSHDLTWHSEIRRFEERLRTDHEIDDLVHDGAHEQVLALAAQAGWRVRALEPWSAGWWRCRLERSARRLQAATHPRLA
jgi:hypothetical protein